MRRISTGIEQLLTADAVAEAVVAYASALARAGTADTVTIPIVLPGGAIDQARLLLGPASQLTVMPADAEETALPGAGAVVQEIERRAARLEPSPVPFEEGIDDPSTAFPDLDDWG